MNAVKDTPASNLDSNRTLAVAGATSSASPTEFAAFEGNPDFVLSLARGLRVIEAFEGHTEGQTVADISRGTSLSRAAARRSLLTLELLGYVESSGRTYRLKTRVLKLGFSYLSSNSLPTIVQPTLEHITELVHESSSLGVLDGEQIVYIGRSTAKRVMSVGLSVGSRLPAYCTSLGRVLLAALPEEELTAYLQTTTVKALTPKTITDRQLLGDIIRSVRSDGFAITDEELELGLRSIAVPVRTHQNRVVAAMNIGVQAARVSAAELIHRFLPILQENAATLAPLLR
jgi:IclR family pca regulon transcriptional regulator